MTSPIVQLPNVQLGNLSSDISSAGGNLIAGLMKQRQLQQQQALQAALMQSTVAKNAAETGEAQARTSQLIPAQTEFYGQRGTALEQKPTEMAGQQISELAGKGIVVSRTPYKEGDPLPPDVPRGAMYIGDHPGLGMPMFYAPPSPTSKLKAETTEGAVHQVSPGPGQGILNVDRKGRVVGQLGGEQGPIKTPSTQMAAAAGAAQAAGWDHATMLDIERHEPQVVQEATTRLAVPSLATGWALHPIVDGEQAAMALKEVGASPDAQRYISALVDFALATAPRRYGKNIRSPSMIYQMQRDFGVTMGEAANPAAVEAKQHIRANALQEMMTQADPSKFRQALQTTEKEMGGQQGGGDKAAQWEAAFQKYLGQGMARTDAASRATAEVQ